MRDPSACAAAAQREREREREREEREEREREREEGEGERVRERESEKGRGRGNGGEEEVEREWERERGGEGKWRGRGRGGEGEAEIGSDVHVKKLCVRGIFRGTNEAILFTPGGTRRDSERLGGTRQVRPAGESRRPDPRAVEPARGLAGAEANPFRRERNGLVCA